MARKNSKETRYAGMNQWQERKAKKKAQAFRKDGKDWTANVLRKINADREA